MPTARLTKLLIIVDESLGIALLAVAALLLFVVYLGCGKMIVPGFPVAMLADMLVSGAIGAFVAASIVRKRPVLCWVGQACPIVFVAIWLFSLPYSLGFARWAMAANC